MDSYDNPVELYTKDKDLNYIIDLQVEKTFVQPQLITTVPSTFTMSLIPNQAPRSMTVLTMVLAPGTRIPFSGIIIINLPSKIIYQDQQGGRPKCYLGKDEATKVRINCDSFNYAQDPGVYGIKELKFNGLCFDGKSMSDENSRCQKDRPIYITIENVRNGISIKPMEDVGA